MAQSCAVEGKSVEIITFSLAVMILSMNMQRSYYIRDCSRLNFDSKVLLLLEELREADDCAIDKQTPVVVSIAPCDETLTLTLLYSLP